MAHSLEVQFNDEAPVTVRVNSIPGDDSKVDYTAAVAEAEKLRARDVEAEDQDQEDLRVTVTRVVTDEVEFDGAPAPEFNPTIDGPRSVQEAQRESDAETVDEARAEAAEKD